MALLVDTLGEVLAGPEPVFQEDLCSGVIAALHAFLATTSGLPEQLLHVAAHLTLSRSALLPEDTAPRLMDVLFRHARAFFAALHERTIATPADDAAALLVAVSVKLLVCAFGREIAADAWAFALGPISRRDVRDAAAARVTKAVDSNLAAASLSAADAQPGISSRLTSLQRSSQMRRCARSH